MEPSLAESLAQTMEPAMVHCWDRSLAASLVPQTASMMATTTERHLAPMMAIPMDHCWSSSLAPNLVHSKASTTVTTMETDLP